MFTIKNFVVKVGIHIIIGELKSHQVHVYAGIKKNLVPTWVSIKYYLSWISCVPTTPSIHEYSALSALEYHALYPYGYPHPLHMETQLLPKWISSPYDSGSWNIVFPCVSTYVTSDQVGLLNTTQDSIKFFKLDNLMLHSWSYRSTRNSSINSSQVLD